MLRPKQKSRNRSVSSVLVTSRQEAELMSYFKSTRLPRIIANDSHDLVYRPKIQSKKLRASRLTKILQDKEKFSKTYFRKLGSESRIQEMDYLFPMVEIFDWEVRGYVQGDYLLLKAVKAGKGSKYYKFVYAQVFERVRRDYRMFLVSELIDLNSG